MGTKWTHNGQWTHNRHPVVSGHPWTVNGHPMGAVRPGGHPVSVQWVSNGYSMGTSVPVGTQQPPLYPMSIQEESWHPVVTCQLLLHPMDT